VGRDWKELENIAREISATGGIAVPIIADLTHQAEIFRAARKILSHFNHVDILVNNAGIRRDSLAINLRSVDWNDVLRTNLTGTFIMTKALLPSLCTSQSGRIINIASVMAQIGSYGQVNYASSKAALIGFTMSLAREIARFGVTVNAVSPGFIASRMTAELTAEQRNGLLARIPLNRSGRVDEVAKAVSFLASDSAGYITGHILNVNGGMHMG
jgi:3-oxoacyl-[acyl-carrier protein] reductase